MERRLLESLLRMHTLATLPALAALSIGAALLPACGQTSSAGRPPNVILVCLDTVRRDHLGAYGYRAHPTTPELDRLAAQGILFEDARACAGWTKPSVPSFMTGTYPMQHGVYEGSAHAVEGRITDRLPAQAYTLAEAFHEQGYATGAFVENDQLDRGLGFEQGFDDYVDDAGNAREIRWRARDWLDARDPAQPFFLYLHMLDAHWPYGYPDEYARLYTGEAETRALRGSSSRALRDAINDGKQSLDATQLATLNGLYDGGLRFMDEELGRLFRWLEQQGLWEQTVVCVIADHGEEFLEHGRVGHGHGLYENLLRVPWILRVPGAGARRERGRVALVDVFPTLLAAARLVPRGGIEGVDRLGRAQPAEWSLAEHKGSDSYLQSLTKGSKKLVRRFQSARGRAGAAPELSALGAGTRWEADLEPGTSSPLRATRLRLRGEPGEPTELKGRITRLFEGGLELEGVEVRLDAGAEYRAAAADAKADPSALVAGAPLKLRLQAGAQGLTADRVKFYPVQEQVGFSLRGTLRSASGTADAGMLDLSGLQVAVDEDTRWEDGGPGGAARTLDRAELAPLLVHGRAAPIADMTVTIELFDLTADPGELHPIRDPIVEAELEAELDARARELSARRYYSQSDRLLLDAEMVRKLRALGYVR
jgi:arylsulfatase A-like enzyme